MEGPRGLSLPSRAQTLPAVLVTAGFLYPTGILFAVLIVTGVAIGLCRQKSLYLRGCDDRHSLFDIGLRL